MRKFSFVLVLFLSLMSCASSNNIKQSNNISIQPNQSFSNMTIAIVDLQKLEAGSIAIKQLTKAFKQKEELIRNNLATEKKSIETDYAKLQEKQTVIDKKALEQQAKKLEQRYMSLQMNERLYGQSLENAKMQVLHELQIYVKKSTMDIGRDFDLVIPSNSLLSYNEKIEDITVEVLKKLNNEFTEIKFEQYYNNSLKDLKKQLDTMIK